MGGEVKKEGEPKMEKSTSICKRIMCQHFYDGGRGQYCTLPYYIVENQYKENCSKQKPSQYTSITKKTLLKQLLKQSLDKELTKIEKHPLVREIQKEGLEKHESVEVDGGVK